MNKLADVDADALREALAATTEAKPAKRLMVALAYLDGTPVDVLSQRYGIPRSTVYYWLDRFESDSIEEAIRDDPRPGRPRELDDDARGKLLAALDDPPETHGVDAEEWTPEMVREFVEREFGVVYSTGHVRRLLREFGDE